MLRLAIPVIVLYAMCCAMALGQTQPQQPNPPFQLGSTTREKPGAAMPQSTEPLSAGQIMTQNGGSLLRATMVAAPDPARAGLKNVSVFAVPEPEPKMVKKHDLITIIIREESEVSSQGTSDLKRQSDLNATADQFIKLNLKNFAIEQGITGAAPSIQLSGSRNFKGEATVDRKDSVITRLTAEVLDVKPNGTLVLQARKKIKNDEEEQTLLCSGVCRVEDLTPDNTVLSTQLMDLEFTKINKGQVRNTTKTGLIHKLLDFINPF
jgi:flagellar L-ring protein precursor FlgH